ncbi:MAG: hypothetical protein QXP36_11055 [Conexivisphaerales archaeon]
MGKVALLLVDFYKVDPINARGFINILDSNLEGGIVITDSNMVFDTKNIKIIDFPRNSTSGLKDAIDEAIENGAEKVVLFENYKLSNALWFIPYLSLDGIVVEKKRYKWDVLNKLADAFSLYPIRKLSGRNIVMDTKSALELLSNDMYTAMSKIREKLEVIREGNIKDSIRELFESLGNVSFWKYIGISLLSYVTNVGAFLAGAIVMPVFSSAFLAGEIGAIVNFFLNSSINLRIENKYKQFLRYNSIAFLSIGSQMLQVLGEQRLGMPIFELYPVNLVITAIATSLLFKFVWSRRGKKVSL